MIFISHFRLKILLQEPVERKLGVTTGWITKQNNSLIGLPWDVVYYVPLLSSLHQLLSDDHILNEVSCVFTCASVHLN